MSVATRQRERFRSAMDAVAVGATLMRRNRAWLIVEHKAMDAGVDLTLRSGRRLLVVSVQVCLTGPCLADVGLKRAAPAPEQRGLWGREGGAA